MIAYRYRHFAFNAIDFPVHVPSQPQDALLRSILFPKSTPMNPPSPWSSGVPPRTPQQGSRTAGSAATAKDRLTVAPVGGWEAAMSESMQVGGKLVGEGAALAAIKDHPSILYLAPVRADLEIHGPQ